MSYGRDSDDVDRNAELEGTDALDAALEWDSDELDMPDWFFSPAVDCEINGYRLVCTCSACPEQYDVFDGSGKQVGYLRLRGGWFRADVPDCGGETVYESYPPASDGVFDVEDRLPELTAAVNAIHARIQKC